MQIDHDPRELSHKALKIIGVLTAVITIALIIPINMAIRWGVTQLPIEVVMFSAGAMLFGSLAFFVGRWDASREFRPSALRSTDRFANVKAFLRFAPKLLIKAPFAVFLIPFSSWKKARENGDGSVSTAFSVALGAVAGLIVTLACVLIIAIPFQA